MDGNKRTGMSSVTIFQVSRPGLISVGVFFLANEYLRAQGLPGLLDEGKIGTVYQGLINIADRHMNAAVGKLDDNVHRRACSGM